MNVLQRLGRPAMSGPHPVRKILTVVLVFNVALGMAFSVIGLRRQAGDRAKVQNQLIEQMSAVNAVRAEMWKSIDQGSVTPNLAGLDLNNFGRDGLGQPVDTGRLAQQLGSFTAIVTSVRSRLDAGQVAVARAEGAGLAPNATALLGTLQALSDEHQRQSDRANTTADVETVVLMLFAAAMGLVLFRRVMITRINSDVRAAQAKARAEATFGSLVRHSSDLISIVDVEFELRYLTPSVQSILGYPPGELVGRSLLDIVHPDDRLRLLAAHDALLDGADLVPTTVRMQSAEGTWRYMESLHNDLRQNADVNGVAITSRDVTERIALEEQLRHSAFHDDLTGLANRALFSDRVEHALSRRYDVRTPPAVVFFDLDDFKAVNDSLGHHIGDQLLQVIAQRLEYGVRPSDTAARLGGDEFAVLIEDLHPDDCLSLLHRLQQDLRQPVLLAGRELSMRASIGVAYAGAGDASTLLANADLAMYAVKAGGKDAVMQFTPTMAEHAVRRLQLKTELHAAIEHGQIVAFFQPTVDLATGRMSGFEALARWLHPSRGLIPPLEFIPIAEQTGQIVEIGRQVLRQACRALAGWHQRHPDYGDLTVAVNLSARELDEPDLLKIVADALRESGLAADRLTLEVTESLLVRDPELAVRQLTAVRKLGVQVAIDDFGTGYSSLNYLEQLPVDIVKIDKTFIDRLTGGDRNVMVETITQLGTALGLRTVAEGIENDLQAGLLRDMGCDVGQGFLFYRPVPGSEIDALFQPSDVSHVA
ncbi:MAG TPA: bifunctional diguanylate cyclase/phosphodiesterase [Jatrophihabitans sp.]|nr:bifunctional diguanylate cyclase/phosphodiesterase [Jatrophihabitans sp.]